MNHYIINVSMAGKFLFVTQEETSKNKLMRVIVELSKNPLFELTIITIPKGFITQGLNDFLDSNEAE